MAASSRKLPGMILRLSFNAFRRFWLSILHPIPRRFIGGMPVPLGLTRQSFARLGARDPGRFLKMGLINLFIAEAGLPGPEKGLFNRFFGIGIASQGQVREFGWGLMAGP